MSFAVLFPADSQPPKNGRLDIARTAIRDELRNLEQNQWRYCCSGPFCNYQHLLDIICSYCYSWVVPVFDCIDSSGLVFCYYGFVFGVLHFGGFCSQPFCNGGEEGTFQGVAEAEINYFSGFSERGEHKNFIEIEKSLDFYFRVQVDGNYGLKLLHSSGQSDNPAPFPPLHNPQCQLSIVAVNKINPGDGLPLPRQRYAPPVLRNGEAVTLSGIL